MYNQILPIKHDTQTLAFGDTLPSILCMCTWYFCGNPCNLHFSSM